MNYPSNFSPFRHHRPVCIVIDVQPHEVNPTQILDSPVVVELNHSKDEEQIAVWKTNPSAILKSARNVTLFPRRSVVFVETMRLQLFIPSSHSPARQPRYMYHVHSM